VFFNDGVRLVIDGIRNIGETDYLSERFGTGFFLLALECPTSQRSKVRNRPNREFPRGLKHIYEQAGAGLEEFRKDYVPVDELVNGVAIAAL
jgi:hypothetical protein